MWTEVRSEVDFVLTFEEMAGIFDAKHIDIENLEEDPNGVNVHLQTEETLRYPEELQRRL